MALADPTTPVITNFTGTDEDPISEGGTWSTPFDPSYGGAPRRLSNQLAGPSGGGAASAFYNVSTYSNSDVYATVATLPGAGNELNLLMRITNPNGAGAVENAYMLNYVQQAGTDTWEWIKFRGDAQFYMPGSPGFATRDLVAGEKIWAQALNSGTTVIVRAFVYTSGAWLQIGTDVVDTDPVAATPSMQTAGYIGIAGGGATWSLDDFGGGGLSASLSTLDFSKYPHMNMRPVVKL